MSQLSRIVIALIGANAIIGLSVGLTSDSDVADKVCLLAKSRGNACSEKKAILKVRINTASISVIQFSGISTWKPSLAWPSCSTDAAVMRTDTIPNLRAGKDACCVSQGNNYAMHFLSFKKTMAVALAIAIPQRTLRAST